MTEVLSFEAQTNFKPNSIRLSWSLSTTLEPTELVIIRRAVTTYPKDPEDGNLVLSTDSSSMTSFDDNGLQDNLYYYYSIFVKDTVSGEFTETKGSLQKFALSYKAWNSGQDLFDLFPEETKSLDYQTGGDLNRLCLVMGNLIDLYRSEVFTMEYIRKPDKAPDNVLDFFSESFGFPAERGIDLNTLRRIAEGIVSIYKRKGTSESIEDFIKLFTGWDNQVLGDVSRNFKLYDEVSDLDRGTLTSVGADFATDNTKTWTDNQWIRGKFSDHTQDNLYTIFSNDSDTLQLDSEPPALMSDSGTMGGGFDDELTSLADNTVEITGNAESGQTGQLVDSALSVYPDNYWNGAYCVITSGASTARRQVVLSFDSDTGTLVFEGDFATPIEVGAGYALQRNSHIVLPGITGYDDNFFAGRDLSITSGTNSGEVAVIARNYELSGDTHLILSRQLTVPCDGTSDITIENSGLFFQDSTKSWTDDEWRGYKLIIGSDEWNVVSNTVDTLKLSPVFKNQGSPEVYSFMNLVDLYPGTSTSYDIVNQYYVYNGEHSFLFSDIIPPEFRGGPRDPAKFLFGGTTRSIITISSIGELELQIIILGAVAEIGRSTDMTVTTLTDSSANFTPNEYVGYKLNPNAQQFEDFEIISNTTDTITVSGNLLLVAQASNNYYIIDKEGSIKTKRLNTVIRQFVPHYLKPIIFHEVAA